MNNYAIISISGKQYKVSEGQEILVDKINNEEIKPVVLLYVSEKEIKIGKPSLLKTNVSLKILENNVKGKKISVQKYRAKSRYRRRLGFRPLYTKLKVVKIS